MQGVAAGKTSKEQKAITELELKGLRVSDDGKHVINGEGNKVDRINDGGSLYARPRVRGGMVTVAFEFRYKMDGQGRAVACGIWPDVSIKAIRNKRDGFRLLVKQGYNPADQSTTARMSKALEEAQQQARIREEQARIAAENAARKTVSMMFADWFETKASSHEDGGVYVRAMFDNHILPHMGSVALPEVTFNMLRDRLKAVAAGRSNENDKTMPKGGRVIANRLYAQLDMMFDFARRSKYLTDNPCESIKVGDYGGSSEASCERYLSEDEICELFRKLPDSGLSHGIKSAIKIILATGCRVGELSIAKWANIDLDAKTWTIPIADQKTTIRIKLGKGKPHVIHLSAFAMDAIKGLETSGKGFVYLFPAGRGSGLHMDEKTISKAIRDKQRGDAGPKLAKRKTSDALTLAGGDWSAHDLRRTMATQAGEMGIDGSVIERMLNHAPASKLMSTYQLQAMTEFQREAWKLWGERLELLSHSDADNVVTLKRA